MARLVRRCSDVRRLALVNHSLFFLVICLATFSAVPSGALPSGREIRREALVYYSNETPSEVISSQNYKTFLRVLDKSGTRSAVEIRSALLEDVADAPKTFLRDVEALRAAAQRANVTLFVFSNALALRKQYLSFSPNGGEAVTHQLNVSVSDDNRLLIYSPLSRPEFLRASLEAAYRVLNARYVALAVIFKSHGSHGVPLMPRVNFDFTQMSDVDLLSALDGVSHDDLDLPELQLQGTPQARLWRTLEEFGETTGTRFPLVFLSSCESGPLHFRDVASIPRNVDLIVHSGMRGMSSQAIDYKMIFSRLTEDDVGLNLLVDKLRLGLMETGQGLQSDTVLTAWRWPFMFYLTELPLWLFGIPVAAWLLWMAVIRYVTSRKLSRQSGAF